MSSIKSSSGVGPDSYRNSLGVDSLQVTSEVAANIVKLASQKDGILEIPAATGALVLTAADARAIVDLAATKQGESSLESFAEDWLPFVTSKSVTLSSGITLTANEAVQIIEMKDAASPADRTFGSGGGRVTDEEAAGLTDSVVRQGVSDQYLASLSQDVLKLKGNMAPKAAQMLDQVLRRGPDVVSAPSTVSGLSPQAVVYPDYDKMLADGVLDHLVVIGYKEGDTEQDDVAYVDRLITSGFVPIERATLTPAQTAKIEALTPAVRLSAMRAENAKVPGIVSYYVKTFVNPSTGQEAIALQRLVGPVPQDTPVNSDLAKAKEAYIKRHMGQVDAFLYAGHARHGTGPDVDPINSPAGNVRLAKGYDNQVASGAYDVGEIEWRNDYQFLGFFGCRTSDYLSGLTNSRFGKRDIAVTDHISSTYGWTFYTTLLNDAVDGLVRQDSINRLMSKTAEHFTEYADADHGIGEFVKLEDKLTVKHPTGVGFDPWPTARLTELPDFAAVLSGRATTFTIPTETPRASVRWLQVYLDKALPGTSLIADDGAWSDKATAAVVAFKAKFGLTPANGTIDRAFLVKLQAVVDAQRPKGAGV